MTGEEAAAQAEVLKRATEIGVFAVELWLAMPGLEQKALERMQRNGWVRLIDVAPITSFPGKLFRVFQASDDAMTWFRKRQ